MGSKTATTPAAQTKALVQHMRDSLLPGDTPFDGPRMQEAAEFVIETAQQRQFGEAAIAIESVTEGQRYTRIAIINDDMADWLLKRAQEDRLDPVGPARALTVLEDAREALSGNANPQLVMASLLTRLRGTLLR